jgi:hypothetical protein
MRREFRRLLSRIDRHVDLILLFVTVFGRFEFALMRAGYIRESKVEAAWYRFGDSLTICLAKDGNLNISKAVSYLYAEPPKRLKRSAYGGVKWTNQKPRNRTNSGLFQLVKDVRNNLLHGGKVPFRPRRDLKLLQSALAVLSFALDLDQDVYEAFCNEPMWVAA